MNEELLNGRGIVPKTSENVGFLDLFSDLVSFTIIYNQRTKFPIKSLSWIPYS